MIDPRDPLEVQVRKQSKIIDALISRANREHDIGGSAYSLFQSAIALQGEVSEKTRDLERALDTLGRASYQLETAETAREQMQRNLGDALDSMEGGFALFTDGHLRIFNDLFKKLIPDISETIQPGLAFDDFFSALESSPSVKISREGNRRPSVNRKPSHAAPFVIALRNDRWFQVSHKQTSSENNVVLLTEITSVVRRNRLEKDRLIDEQAHFLQAAFDHMAQGVCTFSAEGTLLINNARFGEILGLPFALTREGTAIVQILEFVKKNQLIATADPDQGIERWAEILRVKGTLASRIRHANGAILDIQVHGLPDGGFIVNVMDVTVEYQTTEMLEKRVQDRTAELTEANARLREQHQQQAKVEEQLRLAKEEAEAAVSSKTRFLAAASHDLLQPINAAKLLISNLLEFNGDEKLSETVNRLEGSFRSIEQLLHALLDVSRLDSTGTELTVNDFPVEDILRTIREDFSQMAEEKDLMLSILPSSLWVRSDQRYLLRSLQNLVVNAIQYTEKGRIVVGCRRRGDTVALEVWDTGIGISKKDQHRIFTEFTRIGPSKSGYGMGLGLSIVERACRHLGHKVRVRSKPGVGSVFSIELPVVQAGLGRSEQKAPAPSPRNQDMDLIVLIIENDPNVLFATTQMLESWGASVLGADSTEAALKLVDEIGMAPDIILADYQLDDDDNGMKSIRAIRSGTGTDIPAIMITANREESLLTAGSIHRFSVLTKPVQPSRLRSLIDWKTRAAGVS
ncbi:ATP-binding response regulator [Algicella marina]|uniref:histidine kinase n=1 Tax=Algicella marina TaxID=2683284 RepID=A0A6P1T193_9RHOB|nr:PAS-domain containing protein [Algicella marina]QHQ36508.1 response regulator [Algicella marina]